MLSPHVLDWLKLAAAVPPVIAAWKLPVLWNWLKMRFATAAATAVMEQLAPVLATMQRDVESVRYQVFPNGGGSLADSIRRNEDSMRTIARDISLIRDTQAAFADANPELGYFECDATGGNTRVNETYARWLKCGRDELMGWAFLNFVHHDDEAGVREEWELCRRERREYRRRHRMVATDGSIVVVDVRAMPIPPGQEPVSWLGFMRRVEPGLTLT